MSLNTQNMLAVAASLNRPQLRLQQNDVRDPFGFHHATEDGLLCQQFIKSEAHPTSSTSTSSSSSPTTSLPTSSPPPNRQQFPFVDKAFSHPQKDASVKEKLVAALQDIIPHKSTLNLRMLVTYTVDNGESDVIVIDDTLHRQSRTQEPSSSSRPSAELNALDLSKRPVPETIDAPTAPLLYFPNQLQQQQQQQHLVLPPSSSSSLNQDVALLFLQTLLSGGPQTCLPPKPISPDQMDTIGASCMLPLGVIPETENVACRSSSPLSTGPATINTTTPLPEAGSFAAKTSLAPSRRSTHPRRFVCNQCRQQFPLLAELNRHTLEQHSAFRCNFCQSKFTQRSNLQRHSLKHVGFKPFTCNVCEKEYYRKDHLVRHIEVTHPQVDPRANITTRMTSSECLDFLDNLHIYGTPGGGDSTTNEDTDLTDHSNASHDLNGENTEDSTIAPNQHADRSLDEFTKTEGPDDALIANQFEVGPMEGTEDSAV